MASELLHRLEKVDHQGRSGEHEAALGQHRIEQHRTGMASELLPRLGKVVDMEFEVLEEEAK